MQEITTEKENKSESQVANFGWETKNWDYK